jgi:hypothetical protein
MFRDGIQPLVDKILKRIAGWRGKFFMTPHLSAQVGLATKKEQADLSQELQGSRPAMGLYPVRPGRRTIDKGEAVLRWGHHHYSCILNQFTLYPGPHRPENTVLLPRVRSRRLGH